MRILFFLIIISILTINEIFAQQTEASYTIKIDRKKVIDFMEIKNLEVNTKRLTLLMIDAANNSKIKLIFNENNSFAEVEENLNLNSGNIPLAIGILTFINVAYPIYYDTVKKVFYEKRGGDDFPHLVKKEPLKFNWQIKAETKKVGNLTYQKAISEYVQSEIRYNVVAWFCPQIPTQLGPGFFHGLPGLITEINATSHNSEFDYKFILYEFKKLKTNKEITPPLEKYDLLSIDESEKLYEKANYNLKN